MGLNLHKLGRTEAEHAAFSEAVEIGRRFGGYLFPGHLQQLADQRQQSGDPEAALTLFREALDVEARELEARELGANPIALHLARFFVARQLRCMDRDQDALDTLPSVSAAPFLRVLRAQCLDRLGRHRESRSEARLALAEARDAAEREHLRKDLGDLAPR